MSCVFLTESLPFFPLKGPLKLYPSYMQGLPIQFCLLNPQQFVPTIKPSSQINFSSYYFNIFSPFNFFGSFTWLFDCTVGFYKQGSQGSNLKVATEPFHGQMPRLATIFTGRVQCSLTFLTGQGAPVALPLAADWLRELSIMQPHLTANWWRGLGL